MEAETSRVREGIEQDLPVFIGHVEEVGGMEELEGEILLSEPWQPWALLGRKAVEFAEHHERGPQDVAETALVFEIAAQEPFECPHEVIDLLFTGLARIGFERVDPKRIVVVCAVEEEVVREKLFSPEPEVAGPVQARGNELQGSAVEIAHRVNQADGVTFADVLEEEILEKPALA
jgi:hypothetical protein